MERTSSLSCPSFWKLLMDEDFNRGIRIPHSFSSELERRKSPSCNYWRLITDDKNISSNRPWRVKLVKKDHYFYLCRKSWPEFVRYHNLKHGDLLLFHLTDKNTFSITPYGANGSKKKLDSDWSDDSDDDDDSDVGRTPKFHRQDSKHKRKERESSPMRKKARKSDEKDYYTDESEWESGEDGADEQGDRNYRKPKAGRQVLQVDAKSRKEIEEITSSKEASKWDSYIDLAVDNNEKPYFIRTIKDQNKNNVVVPKGFAVGMNLLEPCKIMLRFEDGDHKMSWRAKITQTKNGRIFIRDGWGEFRREYGIQVGETCRFTMAKHRDVPTFSVHVFGSHKVQELNDQRLKKGSAPNASNYGF